MIIPLPSALGVPTPSLSVRIVDDWVLRAGNVNNTIRNAAIDLVSSLQTSGLWSKILRLNLFAGDDLTACLTPLIVGSGNATDTNVNFIAGDYSIASGLFSNGTKYLRTGFKFTKPGSIGGALVHSLPASNNNRPIAGAFETGSGLIRLERPASTGVEAQFGSGAMVSGTFSPGGVFYWRRFDSTDLKLFRNGSLLGSNAALSVVDPPNFDMYIFSFNNNGSASGILVNHSLCGYAFDDGTIDDVEQGGYNTIWQTFQTALGR